LDKVQVGLGGRGSDLVNCLREIPERYYATEGGYDTYHTSNAQLSRHRGSPVTPHRGMVSTGRFAKGSMVWHNGKLLGKGS